MIPRYSLYRDPSNWNNDIQEDPQGQWVKWKDIETYIEFCDASGVDLEAVKPQPGPIQQLPMYGDNEPTVEEIFGEDDVPLDNGEDVYTLITGGKRHNELLEP